MIEGYDSWKLMSGTDYEPTHKECLGCGSTFELDGAHDDAGEYCDFCYDEAVEWDAQDERESQIEEIQEISAEFAEQIITTRDPEGRFIYTTETAFIAIDNRTGDAWTEEFDTKERAIAYLLDEFEVGEERECHTRE